MAAIASGAHDLASLADTLGRLADRLRSLSDVRLARPLPPYASRADAARALAQLLADGAARLEGLPTRAVPTLGDLAVGDQVAVTGTDLISAAATTDLSASEVAAVLTEASTACRGLSVSL